MSKGKEKKKPTGE